MTVVSFKNGSFDASLDMDFLPGHPVPLTRKLFKQLFSDARENAEAIATISRWLAENTGAARKNLFEAETALANPPSMRDRNSRALTNAVKAAKTRYTQLVRLHTLFGESMR